MNLKIREATLNDFDKGLLKVFIEGYRYHQNGRPDIFANLSDEELKLLLINMTLPLEINNATTEFERVIEMNKFVNYIYKTE